MNARAPSWPEVLDAALTARLRSVHTALPGTIRSYSEADQTATVELAVQLESTLEQFAKVPDLADVPVLWPGAWANGDKCLLIFCEENFAKWLDSDGTTVEPPDILQRHGLHALCIPLVAEAGQAVQFVALSNLVDAKLEQLSDAIATAAQAETTASGLGGMNLLATALGISPSVGDPPDPPEDAWPDGSVAASKVKAR